MSRSALSAQSWRLDPARYARRLSLQTRYGDMDSNAHLNNVAIARLFEEARVRSLGQLRDRVAADPFGVMIVHAAIDYLAEGDYPADVEAGFAVVDIGRSSYRIGLGLFQHGRGMALADCVMVNLGADRKSAPVTDALRTALEELRHG